MNRLASVAIALLFVLSCAAVQRTANEHPRAKEVIAEFVVCMLEPAPVLITSGADAAESKRLLFSRFAYCLGRVLEAGKTATTTSVEVDDEP